MGYFLQYIVIKITLKNMHAINAANDQLLSAHQHHRMHHLPLDLVGEQRNAGH